MCLCVSVLTSFTKQAEAEGWLEAGSCGELAAAPVSDDTAVDASAHSVQVPISAGVTALLNACISAFRTRIALFYFFIEK